MTKKTKGKGREQRRKESKSKKTKHQDTAQITGRRDIVKTVLEKTRENKEALRYVALFFVFCTAFFVVYHFLTISGSVLIVHLNNITATILGAILARGGLNVAVNGANLSANGSGLFEIIPECTAVFSSIVYCSAVLAYPTGLKNKCLGIALGVPLLYAINMFRLIVLALVKIYSPNLFEFAHVYFWQASFIIFVIAIFLLWLRVIVK